MKKVIITASKDAKELSNGVNYEHNERILIMEADQMVVSDGYHTFDELYDHRISLFIALVRVVALSKFRQTWRSKLHSDGTAFDGWFILGINKEGGGQITYHLPLDRWDETADYAETLERAPEFDGHTPADVLERLKQL